LKNNYETHLIIGKHRQKRVKNPRGKKTWGKGIRTAHEEMEEEERRRASKVEEGGPHWGSQKRG